MIKRPRFLSVLFGAATAITVGRQGMEVARAASSARINFNFQGIHIYETRSPNTDTNYASLAVRVGDNEQKVEKYIGDLGKGDHGVNLQLAVDVPDDGSVPVVVGWAVINDNDGKDAGLNLAGNVGLAIVGKALYAVPAVGPAVAAVYAMLVSPFKNHNGPVVAQQYRTDGAFLNKVPVGKGGGPLNGTEGTNPKGAKNYGRDLPGNESSDYDSVVWLERKA